MLFRSRVAGKGTAEFSSYKEGEEAAVLGNLGNGFPLESAEGGEAVPSTLIEFVKRLTVQEVTPSTFETAFSTCALHAAQLMPVTENCCIFLFYLF